jgi:hypothetical protein
MLMPGKDERPEPEAAGEVAEARPRWTVKPAAARAKRDRPAGRRPRADADADIAAAGDRQGQEDSGVALGEVKIKTSRLRQNIYRIFDQVLATGVPVDVERNGRRLRIIAVDPPGKLGRLHERDYLRGDPDELVHVDWSGEWCP